MNLIHLFGVNVIIPGPAGRSPGLRSVVVSALATPLLAECLLPTLAHGPIRTVTPARSLNTTAWDALTESWVDWFTADQANISKANYT